MLNKAKGIFLYYYFLTIILIVSPFSLSAQLDPLFTQYINNPLILNPAFAGSRNSLAMDFMSRQQWLGVKGAPASYYYGMHSPINDSKISLGGTILSDHVGPVITNQISFAYSYLLRVNHRTFLSMGLSAGVNNYWLNLHNLDVIDQRDPHFIGKIRNEFSPTAGAGLVYFTPDYYISFSVPQIFTSNTRLPGGPDLSFRSRRSYYFTGGYNFPVAYDFKMHLSGILRIIENDIFTSDIYAGMSFKDMLRFGTSYRFNNSAALIFGVQLNSNWGVFYSYDYPIHSAALNKFSSQEITITYDAFHLFIRNKDREFLRKRGTEEESTVRSIRYF